MKKLLSLLLAICMIASIAALLPVFADEGEETVNFQDGTWTPISNAAEFAAMTDGKYYLTDDIDFADNDYSATGYIVAPGFSGTLDGNNKSLLNVKIEAAAHVGIFGYDFSGSIANLTVGSKDAPAKILATGEGTVFRAASVLICAIKDDAEAVSIENVTVYADAEAQTPYNAMISGLCSSIVDGSDNYAKYTATFKNCHVYGTIKGHPAAGLVALNKEDAPTITFENCTNNATVENTSGNSYAIAGFLAKGYTGDNPGDQIMNLAFIKCTNYGAVTSTGGDNRSAAGFACINMPSSDVITMQNCANEGTIKGGDGSTAGLIAYRNDRQINNQPSTITIENCVNKGEITSSGASAGLYCGVSKDHNVTLAIKNSANVANVTGGGAPTGGIYSTDAAGDHIAPAVVVSIIGCFNLGNVTATDWRAGGIVGLTTESTNSDFTVQYCYNTGAVTNNSGGGKAAGISGETDQTYAYRSSTTKITNCYNIGAIENTAIASNKVAIAWRERDDSYNSGTILVENNFYTNELSATNGKFKDGMVVNTEKVAASELLAKLTAVANADSEVQFVEDIYGINGGNPILSWQIVDSVKAPSFSEGTITQTGDAAYTVGTDGITGFVSSRAGATEGTSDIRFILAVDLATTDSYKDIAITVEFCDAFGVVKTFTLAYEDLDFYLTANGAGNTYTAADGDALFGVIINGVPDSAWAYAVLTVTTSETTAMSGVATIATLG